jgi:hypothetical protein
LLLQLIQEFLPVGHTRHLLRHVRLDCASEVLDGAALERLNALMPCGSAAGKLAHKVDPERVQLRLRVVRLPVAGGRPGLPPARKGDAQLVNGLAVRGLDFDQTLHGGGVEVQTAVCR